MIVRAYGWSDPGDTALRNAGNSTNNALQTRLVAVTLDKSSVISGKFNHVDVL